MTLNKAQHLAVGEYAESISRDYLQQQGLKILQHNYSCQRGEIDIIAREGKTTVFVEVRYRKTTQYGFAEETINIKKQQKLQFTAQTWLQKNKRANLGPSRFDVIAITGEPVMQNIRWIKNAFESTSGF